jgi:glutaminyl-peptide cyclotransferase
MGDLLTCLAMKMKAVPRWLTFTMLSVVLASSLPAQTSRKSPALRPPEYTFKVVHTFPHDPAAYTQGLAYRDGFLYEGTGRNGTSSLRKVRLETGEVLQRRELPQEYFGEGITLIGNEVVQLTWKSEVGFIYDVSDFRLLRQFSYTGEGWGLTTNDREVFMSDGTAEIRVLDIETLKEKRRFTVRDDGIQVRQLNELEFVEGELFANVWQTDRIARISPQTGKVLGWIDLSGILSSIYRRERDSVLNGIAYDAKQKRLFVTGKLWPSIFEIKVVPKAKAPAKSM